MYLVNLFCLSKSVTEFETSAPQICFPVRYLTRCILTYALLVFAGVFFAYRLFAALAVVLLVFAIFYGIALRRLWCVLGLSSSKYILFALLLWIILGVAATALRMLVLLLVPLVLS